MVTIYVLVRGNIVLYSKFPSDCSFLYVCTVGKPYKLNVFWRLLNFHLFAYMNVLTHGKLETVVVVERFGRK